MNKRIEQVDFIKALSIIGVVVIHITATPLLKGQLSVNGYRLYLLLNQIARISVPAFLFASAFTLTASEEHIKHNYFQFLYKRLKRILLPYLIWCFIYTIYTNASLKPLNFIKTLFWETPFYHLYFIPLIFQFYLLFPIFKKIFKSTIGMCAALCINLYFFYIINISNQMPDLLLDKKWLYFWIFYIAFGIWFYYHYEQIVELIRKARYLIIVIFPISIAGVFIDSILLQHKYNSIDRTTTFQRPAILVYFVLFILFAWCVKVSYIFVKDAIKVISKYSFEIYLSHALFLDMLYKSSMHRFWLVSSFVFTFCTALFVSYGINNFTNAISERKFKM